MNRITVNASTKYDVVIAESGLLEKAGELLRGVLNGGKVALVTDSNVFKVKPGGKSPNVGTYAQTIKVSLEKAGFKVYAYVFPAGEKSKNVKEIAKIWSFLARNGFSRADAVVALGGGVTGDLAGFAAATYMRGIRFAQVPTTLLAMVDASVGGKTGVDLPEGKNLAGAFWQPSMVIADTSVLKTLPEKEIKNGAAEVIKSGVLAGGELWKLFDNNNIENPAIEKAKIGWDKNPVENDIKPKSNEVFFDEKVIALSVELKKSIVEADEREGDKRRLLNFGHTAGHAIELLSGYRIAHGLAVAKGMKLVLDAGYKRGVTPPDVREQILKQLERAGLDASLPFAIKDIARACAGDKKSAGGSIGLVVVHGIGDCRILEMPLDRLEEFFETKN